MALSQKTQDLMAKLSADADAQAPLDAAVAGDSADLAKLSQKTQDDLAAQTAGRALIHQDFVDLVASLAADVGETVPAQAAKKMAACKPKK